MCVYVFTSVKRSNVINLVIYILVRRIFKQVVDEFL